MGPGPWFPISREPPAITSRPTLTWTASAVCWSIPAASRRSPKANWTVRRRPFPAQHRSADLRILCVDASANDADIQFGQMGLVPSLDLPAETILVLTKTDLPRQAASSTAWAGLCSTYAPLETSSRSGAGLDALRARLRQAVLTRRAGEGEVVAGTAARCRQSLVLAAEGLARARELVREIVSARNSSRTRSAPPWRKSARWPGWFTPTTCWTASSAGFALGSEWPAISTRYTARIAAYRATSAIGICPRMSAP